MKISFFEEFPESVDWSVFRKITRPATVYIAARSLGEFAPYAQKLRKENPILVPGYWPLLPKSYWVSPFSYPDEIARLHDDLCSYKGRDILPILLDLELPLLRKSLFVKNAFSLRKNKKAIARIFGSLSKGNFRVLTAEYPVSGRLTQKFLELLGISYPAHAGKHTTIVMYYTSVFSSTLLQKKIRRHILKRAQGENPYQVGLGCIATGIFGTEPILPPARLEEDLAFLEGAGIEEAVIFRAGGLNDEYCAVLEKYSR